MWSCAIPEEARVALQVLLGRIAIWVGNESDFQVKSVIGVVPDKLQIWLGERAPTGIPDSQIHLEELTEVMTKRRDKRGVLPAGFVSRAFEAVHAGHPGVVP